MATLTKFTCFATDLGLKKHDLNTDALYAALTDHLPVAGDTTFSDAHFTPPSPANGYPTGGSDTTNLFSAGKMTGTDVVFTATTGGIGQFRYIVLYNWTSASKELVGWYDYGSECSLAVDETFTIDFDPSAGILTIT